MNQIKKKTIYTFNAAGFLLYPVAKAYFSLDDKDVYKMIEDGFSILQKQLSLKGISYNELKCALIPNQDKKRAEMCLVIDTMQIDNSDYGRYVFKKLIPLLDKKSTYSILCGDYIDRLYNLENAQLYLYSALKEGLREYHSLEYRHSSQYFLIYFNRLTSGQQLKITEGLSRYPWFSGFVDLTYSSRFKTYISHILAHVCVKNRDKIIVSHPSDYQDEENINMRGLPFEDNGYKILSVNEDSFGAFLSYKIEKYLPDVEDVSFSFNALFPQFNSYEKISLKILNKKWEEYLTNKNTGKGKILVILGYGIKNKEEFQREIFKQICANYIYNLEENEFGDLKFNVCVELPTIHGNLRRTTIALKYFPEKGEVSIITIT